jgi:peptide/nickel transport system substrate-binding protein
VNKPAIAKIHSPLSTDNKQLPVGMDTGALDLTTSESITPDLLPTLNSITAKGKVKLLNQVSFGYEHLDFNTQKAPFNDARVRQAVLYALDLNAINNAVFAGGLTILNSWLPPTNWASSMNPNNIKNYPDLVKAVPQYSYDVAKANSLLDAAGWTKGPDGIRVKDGKRFTLDWLTTTKSYRKLFSAAAQQYMQAVGIEDTPDPKPAGQVFAPPPDGPLYSGSYGDFGLIEFAYGFTSDEPGGDSLFDTTQIPSASNSFGGGNDEFWSNSENDQLLRQADAAPGHTAERITAYLKQQAIVMTELPTAPLLALPTLTLYKSKLTGLRSYPGGFIFNCQELGLSK